MAKFLSNIKLEQANDIQFKTTAGVNAGKIEQDGNNLVLTNAVGDILLGDGSSDVFIGDGTNNVDIIFEQSGSIKGDGSAVTLTLGGSNTTLNLENPNINGNLSIGATTINNKLTFTTNNGFILFDYEAAQTGEYTSEVPLLKIDRGGSPITILSRVSSGGAVVFGCDDMVHIAGGDTKAVIKDNLNMSSEIVVFSSEAGFRAYGFPSNDTSWSNRNEFRFRSDSGTASENGLYIGDGGNTQFIDLSRNLSVGTIGSGAITSTGKITGTELEGTSLDINGNADISGTLKINSVYTANTDANDLQIGSTTTGNGGLSILTGNTNTGGIFFGDNDNNDAGRIKYIHSSNSLLFDTNRTNALTINSSQNATFAGTIATPSLTLGANSTITASETTNDSLYLQSAGTGVVRVNYTGGLGGFEVYTGNNQTMQLTANSSGITIPEYIIHASDTNTYFGFSGSDTFIVHTGGSDRFSVTGDVHVKGSTDFAIPAGRKLYLDGQSNTYITESSADNIKFFTGGSEALDVDSNQNATFAGTVTASSYKISSTTVLQGTADVILGSAGGTGTISLTTHTSTPFKIENDDTISIGSNATFAGNINIDEQSLYLYNASNNYWRVQNNSSGKLVFKQGTTQRGIWSSGELELTNDLVVGGELEAASLDINGAADISGATVLGGDLTINGSTSGGAVTPRTLNFTTNPTNAGLSGANEYLIGEIAFTGKDSSTNAAGKYIRIRGSLVDGNTLVQGSGGEGGKLQFTLLRHDVGAQPRVEYDILTLSPTVATFAGEVEATSLDINGGANIAGNLDMVNHTLSANTVTADQLNLKDGGDFITFYGGDETNHSISSRDSAGSVSDDLRINSYGALYINLDSNNNNTSAADFVIGRHGSATGTIVQDLLTLSGETGKLGVNGEVEATSLDINGNADISGNTSMSGTLSVGNHLTLTTPAGNSQTGYALKLMKTSSSGTEQVGAELMATAYPTNTNGGNLIFKTANSSAVATTALTIDGAQHASFVGNVTIAGNLTTEGDLIINNTSNVSIKDTIITLNSGITVSDTRDIGLMFERVGNNKFFGWDESESHFTLAENTQDVSVATTTQLTMGTLQTLRANVHVDTLSVGSENPAQINAIKDEDNMASDSATSLATQQSIKAYADGLASNYATSAQGTLATNALPKAGGTMTGHTLHGDNVMDRYGSGNDFSIYHNGTNGVLQCETGIITMSSDLTISKSAGDTVVIIESDTDNNAENDNPRLEFKQDGGAVFMHVGTAGNVNNPFTNALTNQGYLRSATGLQFVVNSTTSAMTINSSGNVGIGTTSSSYPFSLENSGTGLISRIYNTNADGQGLLIRAGATSSATRAFQVASSNDTKIMTVNSNGRVGIGTNSPTSPLTIKSNSTSSADSGLTIQSTGNTNAILKIAEKSTDGGRFHMYDGGVEKIAFYTDGTANHISAGNFGIGTSSPSEKIQVNGVLAITANDTAYAANYFTKIKSNYSANPFIIESKYGDLIKAEDYGKALSFHTGNTATSERIRILSSGNVGIGTASPGALLHVSGDNTYDGIQISGASIPTLSITDTTNNAKLVAYARDSDAHIGTESDHTLTIGTNNTTALTISNSQNATFAGRTDLQKDLRIRGNDSSGNLGVVRFLTDANDRLIIDTGNDGANQTIIDGSGNATFTGEVQAASLDINGVADINSGSTNIPIELTSSDNGCYIRYKDGADANRWYAGVNNGNFDIYNNGNSAILRLSGTQCTIAGELEAASLDINGAADISGDLVVAGKITQSGIVDYERYGRTYTVNVNAPLPILTHGGNALPTGGGYRVTGHISGTGTEQVAMAVFWNENGTWNINKTFEGGTSSNHVEFKLLDHGSGSVPTVTLETHTSNYTVHVYHERLSLEEGSGTDNLRGYFGADSYLSWLESTNTLTVPGSAVFTGAGEFQGNIFANVSNAGGFMLTGSSASGLVRNNGTGVALRTNTTDRLVIDNSGNATFGGNVTAGSNSLTAGSLDINGNADISGTLNVHSTLKAHNGQFYIEDSNSDNYHFQLVSNSTEGRLTISNGSNWGLIARGKGNSPRLGAYHNGTLDIYGFGSSDAADHADDDLLAQFDFANEQFTVNGEIEGVSLDINGNADISGVLTTAGGIAHTSDTDTLLEFTGANELKIKAGGATHFHAGSDQTTHLYSGNALTLSCDTSQNATFAGDVTVEGGLLHLGKADTASGHINAKELMTFNIDTDNDDTNRYFGFYVNGESGSGTELLKILETGNATFAGELTVGSHVNMGDGDRVKLGASSDLQIVHTGSASYIHNVNDTSGHLYLKQSSDDNDIIFIGKDNGTEFTALTLDMSDAGKATFNNDVVAFSDKKLKENIETLDGKKVLDMRGVSFTRKDTGLPSSGVIAQEIQEVAPELVSETNGTLGVSYGNLVGYLIEAVKDQQKQIDELKAIINGSSK